MPIEIDYAGLRHAMTHHDPYEDPLYYLDTATGQVLAVTRETEKQAYELADPDQTEDPEIRLAWHILWRDGEPIGPELSEAEEEAMYGRVEAFLDRYAAVPTIDSCESYQDMADFGHRRRSTPARPAARSAAGQRRLPPLQGCPPELPRRTRAVVRIPRSTPGGPDRRLAAAPRPHTGREVRGGRGAEVRRSRDAGEQGGVGTRGAS